MSQVNHNHPTIIGRYINKFKECAVVNNDDEVHPLDIRRDDVSIGIADFIKVIAIVAVIIELVFAGIEYITYN